LGEFKRLSQKTSSSGGRKGGVESICLSKEPPRVREKLPNAFVIPTKEEREDDMKKGQKGPSKKSPCQCHSGRPLMTACNVGRKRRREGDISLENRGARWLLLTREGERRSKGLFTFGQLGGQKMSPYDGKKETADPSISAEGEKKKGGILALKKRPHRKISCNGGEKAAACRKKKTPTNQKPKKQKRKTPPVGGGFGRMGLGIFFLEGRLFNSENRG